MRISLIRLTSLAVWVCCLACQQNKPKQAQSIPAERQEAIDDSLALAEALLAQSLINKTIPPLYETTPVRSAAGEDAADDPAIWIHPTQPEASRIYGSNKRAGIVAYDLQGQESAFYPVGRINNIDVIQGISHGNLSYDLLGGTNRTNQSLEIFAIDDNGALKHINGGHLDLSRRGMDDVYGFCFGQYGDQYYAYVNAKNGMVRQYALGIADSTVYLTLLSGTTLDSQPEGMVFDSDASVIYIGEEDLGIWMFPGGSLGTKAKLIQSSREDNNKNIRYDIEGLTIYERAGKKYLLASSQGNFSYAVFDIRDDHKYLGSFTIKGGSDIDGAEETDGIDATSVDLGSDFPYGLMVAQDGFNYDGDKLVNQNFKIVAMQDSFFEQDW